MTALTHVLTQRPFTRDSLRAAVFATDGTWTPTMLRATLGLVLFPHGAQHLLGWFGGYGFEGTMAWMTGTVGIPAPLAAAGILLEFFGPLALLAGVATRLFGAALAVFMATAASTHLQHGFFMNWYGNLPAGSEGFEFHLLAIAMAGALAISGGGAWSVDRALGKKNS